VALRQGRDRTHHRRYQAKVSGRRGGALEQILTEYPLIEVVRIQFNYADYEDLSLESRKVYEVAEKHGKSVIVIEPVKGGSLVNLPEEA